MVPGEIDLHIDWLSVSQVHDSAPDWGSALTVDYDPQTGEAIKSVIKSGQLQGSWESSLMIRCSGGKVEVSGNPSKWGRLESVGNGCRTIFQAIAVYNRVLEAEGLPLFSFPDRIQYPGQGGAVDRTDRKGPRIQWVHIAANLILGSAVSLDAYFDWLSTQRVGVRGHVLERKGPHSVRGGTRRRRSLVIYGKGAELREQIARWRRKLHGDVDLALGYLQELARRCDALGWLRQESRHAGEYLKTRGLQWVEDWGDTTMAELWNDFRPVAGEVGSVIDWKGEALSRFLGRGLGDRAARQRVETLLAWMGGADVGPGPGRSRATWYRVAKDLREVLGVDIRDRPNVVTLGSRVQRLAKPVQARYATRDDVDALYRDLPPIARVA